ncbi:efflux RND transporter permease subunit [Zavarzinia compransoris]|uniref:Efflux pump membrane transporter n=1 Tax=Zavarzinia compransoris TaxID=1264899 RepID=A0A317E6J9_9PROT|nr:multidrug efflux RND transporter permease subunit [Zavarzinia compransoris]PWR21033.1 hydrophobe/amphiphile efflux-1 family RND transporter [Zavarzinia compransoris]TDP44065.1 hydrophobe/amphiphile efflux-1 (HAE1) family protein [Zavarzinia compransoris]
MRIPHFFIDRPIFAAVLSIVVMLVGGIAYFRLPVAQYPEIAPPTVVVTANYPGANPETIATTVAAPIEEQVNGIEGMLYMRSYASSDGRMQLTVTFAPGTNLDTAQVLVQNRVAIAEPLLPETVRRSGVTTAKSSPDLLLLIHLLSPDGRFDSIYISNYVTLQIRDVLARIDGVGSIIAFGARDYAMRIWLDPEKMAAFNVSVTEVNNAIAVQNNEVAGGRLGQQPIDNPTPFEIQVRLQGRLQSPEEFADIIVKATGDGRFLRIRDVGRVELAARDYNTNSYLDGLPAQAIGVFQRPGSNAVATAAALKAKMQELAAGFPDGLEYRIVYNPTDFVEQSLKEVVKTLFEAVALVVLVVFVFLQSWRATIIPIVAIPVALVGTFAIMAGFGFSLNTLSMFGLVLAIGIVVDDAIVVVEAVEHHIAEGLSPRDAARQTMTEVSGALVAIAVVLIAVFLPTAFIPGISGVFYKQFAITVAVATAISAFNSLTLSPALAALLLRPKQAGRKGPLARAFGLFNRGFDWTSDRYGRLVGGLTRRSALVLLVYAGLIGLTVFGFTRQPTGFIPMQDRGFLIGVIQLPPGSSLARSDDVVRRAGEIAREVPGVAHTVQIAGFSGATFTSATNAGTLFIILDDAGKRAALGQTVDAVAASLRQRLFALQEGFALVIPPPPVQGIGNAGGFSMQVQDRGGLGLAALKAAADDFVQKANQVPGLTSVYTPLAVGTPQLYVDIDRVRAQILNVSPEAIFSTVSTLLGSSYINDLTLFGRSYRVTVQADAPFRIDRNDIAHMRARSNDGAMVPLGSVATFREIAGPDLFIRYNQYAAAPVTGSLLPGVSSGQAMAALERLAAETLPQGISFEWTELSYQERAAGNVAFIVFPLAVLFVFLALAAQYESWALPLAIILIVPMCLLSALGGIMLRQIDNNILVQIGFVVLVGLASKNAILIVEFARQLEDQGRDRFRAVLEACRLRLRPILMTSFAFTLGVVPLAIATGAGAEMRQALGTAVVFGMLGVTLFGLLFTPVFYTVIRGLIGRARGTRPAPAAPPAAH